MARTTSLLPPVLFFSEFIQKRPSLAEGPVLSLAGSRLENAQVPGPSVKVRPVKPKSLKLQLKTHNFLIPFRSIIVKINTNNIDDFSIRAKNQYSSKIYGAISATERMI